MREFIDLVSEAFIHGFVPPYNKGGACEVFKNPDRAELTKIKGQNDDVRAFLVDDDIYVWSTFQSLHQTVREELNLPTTAIPIQLLGDLGDEGYAYVTDNTRYTPLWHSTSIGSEIRYHPFMKRFSDVEVGYYDEAIVGDWADLKQDIDESPIGDYKQFGDWSDTNTHVSKPLIDPYNIDDNPTDAANGNSFVSKIDRALIQDPRTEQNLRVALRHIPVDIHLFFLNSPGGLTIASDMLDFGSMAPNGSGPIAKALGDEVVAAMREKLKSDPKSCVVILTHNEGGAKRHPMTPWMIAHRMAHAMEFSTDFVQDSINGLITNAFGMMPGAISMESEYAYILRDCCTFKSARDRNILLDAIDVELNCEILTQYMMTGKVTFRIPDSVTLAGNRTYPLLDRARAQHWIDTMAQEANEHSLRKVLALRGRAHIC